MPVHACLCVSDSRLRQQSRVVMTKGSCKEGKKEGREKSEGGEKGLCCFTSYCGCRILLHLALPFRLYDTVQHLLICVDLAETLPTYMYTYYFLYGTLLFLAKALSPIITKASVLKMLPRHCY